jgi:DNA-directed RNA polymerase subunit RPC12/RpoP
MLRGMLEELSCPRCGADLHLQPGATVAHCQYCGSDSLVEELAPRASQASEPVNDLASVASTGPGAARDQRRVVAGLLCGILFAVGLVLALALPSIRAHSARQARAARLREAMTGVAEHTRELSDRLRDASLRHDAEGQRKAQADLDSYNKELASRVQEIWREP